MGIWTSLYGIATLNYLPQRKEILLCKVVVLPSCAAITQGSMPLELDSDKRIQSGIGLTGAEDQGGASGTNASSAEDTGRTASGQAFPGQNLSAELTT